MYDSNNYNNIDDCQKFPGETFFAEFQLTVFKNKRTFIKKLYYIQPLFDIQPQCTGGGGGGGGGGGVLTNVMA